MVLPSTVVFTAVVLHLAVGSLRIDDDLHEPPQDGSDFGSGCGSGRVETVVCLARKDARLLHGLDRFFCPGRNTCAIRKIHSFQSFRDGVAQFGSVVLHNDRHLLAVDVGIRAKVVSVVPLTTPVFAAQLT